MKSGGGGGGGCVSKYGAFTVRSSNISTTDQSSSNNSDSINNSKNAIINFMPNASTMSTRVENSDTNASDNGDRRGSAPKQRHQHSPIKLHIRDGRLVARQRAPLVSCGYLGSKKFIALFLFEIENTKHNHIYIY